MRLPELLRPIHHNSNLTRECSLTSNLRRAPIIAFVAILFALPLQAQEAAPPAPSYEINGSARSGKTPLPGAAVTAANTLTGKKYAAVTNADGQFSFSGIARGRYVVRIEFMGFSLFTRELLLNPQNPSAKVDAELLLAATATAIEQCRRQHRCGQRLSESGCGQHTRFSGRR